MEERNNRLRALEEAFEERRKQVALLEMASKERIGNFR